MNLWCSKCHTLWTEGVLDVGKKCPFVDCAGWLTTTDPARPAPKPKVERKTFPLLGDAK